MAARNRQQSRAQNPVSSNPAPSAVVSPSTRSSSRINPPTVPSGSPSQSTRSSSRINPTAVPFTPSTSSQIPTKRVREPTIPTAKCTICFDECIVSPDPFASALSKPSSTPYAMQIGKKADGHLYCIDCLGTYITKKLEDGWKGTIFPILCPGPEVSWGTPSIGPNYFVFMSLISVHRGNHYGYGFSTFWTGQSRSMGK